MQNELSLPIESKLLDMLLPESFKTLIDKKFELIFSMNKRERNALGLKLAVKIAKNEFDINDEISANILQLVREIKGEIIIDDIGNVKFI